MLYTLKQAAEMVELSADTLRKYINLGKLKAKKRGRDWFLTSATINKLQERRKEDGFDE